MIVILYPCFDSDTRMLRRDDSECENVVFGFITQTLTISMYAILCKFEDFMGGE